VQVVTVAPLVATTAVLAVTCLASGACGLLFGRHSEPKLSAEACLQVWESVLSLLIRPGPRVSRHRLARLCHAFSSSPSRSSGRPRLTPASTPRPAAGPFLASSAFLSSSSSSDQRLSPTLRP